MINEGDINTAVEILEKEIDWRMRKLENETSVNRKNWYQRNVDDLNIVIKIIVNLWEEHANLKEVKVFISSDIEKLKKILALGLSTNYDGERVSCLNQINEIINRQ